MSKSKSSDGRRGNRPPDKHKIRAGEVRNPYGRKGKGGGERLSRLDEFYLKEAQRIVSRDGAGDVDAAKRLVQEEYAAALVDKDSKVRGRLLTKLSLLEAKVDKSQSEFEEWFFTSKFEVAEGFRIARERRLIAPDMLHPDHVALRGDKLIFTGPLQPAFRKQWEQLKANIKICAHLHEICRQRSKRNPTELNVSMLSEVEASRRRLMRAVPKGWNWREEIYCRDSQARRVEEALKVLEGLR